MRSIFILLLFFSLSAGAQESASTQVLEQTEVPQNQDQSANDTAQQSENEDMDSNSAQNSEQDPNMPAANEQATEPAPQNTPAADTTKPSVRTPIHLQHRICNNPKAANMTQAELDALSPEEFEALCGAFNSQAQSAGVAQVGQGEENYDQNSLAADAANLAAATGQGTTLADIKQATQAAGLEIADTAQQSQQNTTAQNNTTTSLDNVSNQMGDVSARLRNAKTKAAQNTTTGASGIKRGISGWGSGSGGSYVSDVWPLDHTTGYHNGNNVKGASSPSVSKSTKSSSSSSWGTSSSSGRATSSSSSNMAHGSHSSSASHSSGGSRTSAGSSNMGGHKTSASSSSGSKKSSGGSTASSGKSSSSKNSSANMEGGSSKQQKSKPASQEPGLQSAGESSSGLQLYGNSGLLYDESYLFPYGDPKPESHIGELKDASSEKALKEIFNLNDDGKHPTYIPY
ncbi:MAG: hypothetical protein II942_04315 [Alphaproteobacteria bacterium]|nr:hypothetical protein [Alphaproteobacteria bacterium]